MLNFLYFIDKDIIMLAFNKTLLEPGIEVVLGLDVLEGFLFLVDVNDVGIRDILILLFTDNKFCIFLIFIVSRERK